MFDSLFHLGLDATMLGFEAQSVVGLRLLRLAGGGAVAQAEAHRMVAEKGAAFVGRGDPRDRRLGREGPAPLPYPRAQQQAAAHPTEVAEILTAGGGTRSNSA